VQIGLKAAMDSHCKSSLKEVIELHIIPRLVDSHAIVGELKVQEPAIEFVPDAKEVAAFARICIHEPATTATQRIEQWVQQGHAIDDIFLKRRGK
jgi:hypothetical protein